MPAEPTKIPQSGRFLLFMGEIGYPDSVPLADGWAAFDSAHATLEAAVAFALASAREKEKPPEWIVQRGIPREPDPWWWHVVDVQTCTIVAEG